MPIFPKTLQHFGRSLGVAVLLSLTAAPSQAQGFAGPYLAARIADAEGDFEALVDYGTRALIELPDNVGIMEGLLIAYMGLGDIEGGVPIARRLDGLDDGNDMAALVLMADAMEAGRWAEVDSALENGFSVGGYLDPLIQAWSAIGQGKMSDAISIFDTLTKDDQARQAALFQKAIALAYVGDFEGAAFILGGEVEPLNLNRPGIVAYAQVLSQLERNADALEMIEATLPNVGDEEIETLRLELAAGKPIGFDAVKRPQDALSALFFEVGQALAAEGQPSFVLIYSRISQHLNRQNIGAVLLTAALFENMGQHDLAVATYDQVSAGDLAYPQAMLGKAEALRRDDLNEEAAEVLRALAQDFPDLAPVHVALGDAMRFDEKYEEAVAAYDAALALFEEPSAPQWVIYFARAISLERLGQWPKAEADFRMALELEPDQPAVLNYLGYSYVEKRENLDEALEMIEKAVVARPGDAYITDSLGWVLYRLGRYEEAVVHMERAASLMPVDPVVNDHLGDVYYAVGRTLEAQFQWRRALSFITEDTDVEEVKPDRIRRKLEVGLDVVLDEEGGDPIQRAAE
ncbi:MAG: tetratricopeptide repeat protein [Maritimibacter sp.]